MRHPLDGAEAITTKSEALVRLQMGLKQMKIATKLLTLLLGVGILPLLFMGWIVLEKSGAALSNQAFAQLESLRDVKKLEVERYFNRLHSQMVTFSENRMVVTSLRQLKQVHSGFGMENQVNPSSLPTLKQSLKRFYINNFNQEYRRRNDGQDSGLDGKLGFLEETTIALQYHYLLMDSNPIGEKNLLDKAGDQSTYTRIHEVYHPSFRNYAKEFNYSDLYLIDSETGHIIYSVSKGIDFGTSLRSGLFSESPFAAVFQHAADAQDKDAVSMSDFSLYPAAFNEPVLFIASPVVEGGSTIGVVAFQINSDGLNQIMNERSGMGETGETFLVGPDHLMLSDSITDSQNRSVVAS
ncbi:MAG: cache domain-containing protein, partial [Desulfobacterales bacterium]